MLFVCTLDLMFYSKFSNDIVSNEVIITDKQIEHIKSRHPEDFEQYNEHFAGIINNPDCVLEGNDENTLLLLKEICLEKNRPVKLILRLKTSKDPGEYKNSIITFTRTDSKEVARLLKKKRVLYAKASYPKTF